MQQLKQRKSVNRSMNTSLNNSIAYASQPMSPSSRNGAPSKELKPKAKFNIGQHLTLQAPKSMLGKYSTSTKTSARKYGEQNIYGGSYKMKSYVSNTNAKNSNANSLANSPRKDSQSSARKSTSKADEVSNRLYNNSQSKIALQKRQSRLAMQNQSFDSGVKANKFAPKHAPGTSYLKKKVPGTAQKKPVKYQVDLRSERSGSALSNRLVTKSFDSQVKKKVINQTFDNRQPATNKTLHKKSPAKMNISFQSLLNQS